MKDLNERYRFSGRPRVVLFANSVSCAQVLDTLTETSDVIGLAVAANRIDAPRVKDVYALAWERRIPVFIHPLRSKVGPFVDIISACRPDVGVLWSYSQLFYSETLALFPFGVWNMHGGKIPEYRGANVLQWSIINGETECGVTWHLIDEQVDAGRIIAESSVPIEDADCAADVSAKITATLGVRFWARA